MPSLVIILFLILVLSPLVPSKLQKMTKITKFIFLIFGLFSIIIINYQYFDILNFWDYSYHFSDRNIEYKVQFPRKPILKEYDNKIILNYQDDHRAINLEHYQTNIKINIDETIEKFTDEQQIALISKQRIDNSYLLRFNTIDDNNCFIVIHKRIYQFEDSILELTYRYYKTSEKVIKDVERFLEIKKL